ncbi:DUF3010 family protein [Aliarcobacter skirrowii]|uniref:DUF3010 family protein n=1 Tax=Aliarcobacter skirrowii TaxID=28200 RepID=UPI0029A8B1BF|nr:DUF3010 family protein [Aliarcobacter skirrowii]MDX4065582.1 DUF3010 family protein [Aliarcobacter skirrowii]
MKICGIELKASDTILAVIEVENNIIHYISLNLKKISIQNDENKSEIESFHETIKTFLRDNNIDKIIIKKRAKRGKFAGGADTFKMEGIIQLNGQCDVNFTSTQAIASYKNSNAVTIPTDLLKYQEEAYLSALTGI